MLITSSKQQSWITLSKKGYQIQIWKNIVFDFHWTILGCLANLFEVSIFLIFAETKTAAVKALSNPLLSQLQCLYGFLLPVFTTLLWATTKPPSLETLKAAASQHVGSSARKGADWSLDPFLHLIIPLILFLQTWWFHIDSSNYNCHSCAFVRPLLAAYFEAEKIFLLAYTHTCSVVYIPYMPGYIPYILPAVGCYSS